MTVLGGEIPSKSVSLPRFVSVMSLHPLEDVTRDLGERELWERSLARSLERRAGRHTPRSLASTALADLDGPLRVQVDDRDLSDPELWDYSAAIANGKRIAAQPGFLPQARMAGATLVVAAVAAALPNPGGSTPGRAKSSGGATRVHIELLKVGSRGPAVARVQRELGILADGIFGPQTRRAVRAFQKRHGLLVDGIVGPQTRKALFAPQPAAGAKQRYIRAWWVVPVQRALGVPADGLYGPVTRQAVRAFQKRKGLVVDGVVGPQTLGALGIRRSASVRSDGGRQAAPAPSSRGARVAQLSRRYLGVPYRWGGSSPSTGFDCSGFVMYLYAKVGVSLPHNAAMQYRYGRAVSRSNLRAGDLVFFNGLGHVGIYLGGGRFIHAPSSGDVVKISSLGDSWYRSRWVGARRI
jgi:peptidoglycan hydrolase-like protein with peptidoglycan-binding domain